MRLTHWKSIHKLHSVLDCDVILGAQHGGGGGGGGRRGHGKKGRILHYIPRAEYIFYSYVFFYSIFAPPPHLPSPFMGSTLASAYTHKQDTVTQLTFLYARKSQSFLSITKFFCFYYNFVEVSGHNLESSQT